MPAAAPPPDAEAATDRDSWVALIERIADEAGYLEPLGDRHWAFFHDDGPVMLVTFEGLDAIRARPGQMPLGWTVARAHGWSHLCLVAEGETWWRDRRVWGYFDRLVDDAFFEDFDRVCFYGAGAGGYAAAAYSVASPGASVLSIRPRATLDPAVTGWDPRTRPFRRMDFTSRYGFAPDMTEGAGRVFVVVDPAEPLDAMHAALFRRPWTTRLPARFSGPEPEAVLAQAGILEPLIAAVTEGRLTTAAWARLWRARRVNGPWLRNVAARLSRGPSRRREALFCRAVLRHMNAPKFRRRLAELTEMLAAEGIALPPPRG